MEQRHKTYSPSAPKHSTRLWLAAADGRRRRPNVAPADRPELPMVVVFEGLSSEEQRRAVGGFPGGRRFVLLS